MNNRTLLKVGGAELEDGPEIEALADALSRLIAERQMVVVHGGGPEIARLQERLGLKPNFIDGLRVTDQESLRVAEMVLSGAVNKRLTARLVTRGAKAIGMSGIDCGLLRAAKVQHPKGDLGCVGEIVEVQTAPLLELLSLGYTPVISPISLGADGRPLNVNADHAALAIARALQVQEAIFLTNVPGVLVDGQVMAELSSEHAQQLIEAGHITGGMIPKVQSALQVIACGVQAVRITNLEGLAQASGTRVSA
ncbi:MAG: acetylglutamate kinase [Chloroflexi bacterium]|jgi:acetylglutamate kinase|nr:acetylglutamate kinase [Chloroflexota bacterium]